MAKTLVYALTIEPHPEDGGFLAYFPSLPGCHTWGGSYHEAVKNAEEALSLYLETAAEHGDLKSTDPDDIEAIREGLEQGRRGEYADETAIEAAYRRFDSRQARDPSHYNPI